MHRLDKDTSGILLIARSTAAARWLTAAFREKTARKIYWALVLGEVKPRIARIDIPISKLPGKAGEKMAVDYEQGQKALTDYEVVEQLGRRVAWLALSPVTGRTHQLRVHMMERRAPILGDGKYGGPEAFLVAEGLSETASACPRGRGKATERDITQGCRAFAGSYGEGMGILWLRSGSRGRSIARGALDAVVQYLETDRIPLCPCKPMQAMNEAGIARPVRLMAL